MCQVEVDQVNQRLEERRAKVGFLLSFRIHMSMFNQKVQTESERMYGT